MGFVSGTINWHKTVRFQVYLFTFLADTSGTDHIASEVSTHDYKSRYNNQYKLTSGCTKNLHNARSVQTGNV